jgi:hypothetical protein
VYSDFDTSLARKDAAMNALPATLRLVHTFDPLLLQTDIARVVAKVTAEPAGSGDGDHRDWTSITLFPTHAQLLQSRRGLRDSELLQLAPHVREALERLRCAIQRVRLQSLGPAGLVAEHSDELMGIAAGLIRIHIPVVTNPDVFFYIDGQRCVWHAGELWYGDFSRLHKVANHGCEIRRHLVIDVYANDLIVPLFPNEARPLVRAQMEREARDAVSADLQGYTFNFHLPAGIELPGIGSTAQAVVGRICPFGNQLMLVINHEPRLKVQPLTTSSLSILGLGTPAVVRVERVNGKVASASVTFTSHHRELPLQVLDDSFP